MVARRLNVLYYGFCVALAVIAGRLFMLQALRLSSEDPNSVLRRGKPMREISAFRGAICSRDGKTLAADMLSLDLAIPYQTLRDTDAWIAPVCEVAGADPTELTAERDRIVARVQKIHDSVVNARKGLVGKGFKVAEEVRAHVICQDISVEAAAWFEADPKRFPGFTIQTSHRRVYPEGNIAPHLIGYLKRASAPQRGEDPEDYSVQPGDRIGDIGVEKQYDRLLRGAPGIGREEVGDDGRLRQSVLFSALPGRTLTLTIDAAAQKRAEELLAGRSGSVVVMDVQTGELLVLASSPLFDITDLSRALAAAQTDPTKPMLSRATQWPVNPGSTAKLYVMLGAAEAGAVTPHTPFECDGVLPVPGRDFHCSGVHGTVDMAGAIMWSCNEALGQTARRSGPGPILSMMARVGFGRKTGLDLPGEVARRLPNHEAPNRRWSLGDTLNICIGQGDIDVTPVQLVVAVGSVANGGRVLRPRVLKQVDPPHPDATRFLTESPEMSEVRFDPAALAAVRAGMRRSVVSGSARNLTVLRDMNAAVKTGTAETLDETINQCWISGFLPYDRPRYAFVVVIHESEGVGAVVAGPIAAGVMQEVVARP